MGSRGELMGKFNSSLVGVTFNNRQNNIPLVNTGQKLFWSNESTNPFDSNAILVYADEDKKIELGHLRADLAVKLMDRFKNKKCDYELFVERVTGGGDNMNLGLNIVIYTRWIKDGSVKNKDQ